MAGEDAHALAASKLKEAGVHVPRACLLRRVSATLGSDASFAASLSKAGLRGDRLSLWALQVTVLLTIMNKTTQFFSLGS